MQKKTDLEEGIEDWKKSCSRKKTMELKKAMGLDEGFVFDRRDPKKSWGRTFLGVLGPKLIMDC